MLGPEAPLIAIGSGLGALAVRLAARDAPAQATAVIATAGSFAAVSTLFGSPLLGAFLLLEAAGLGGPMLGVVLVPGLLAAGVGSLIFLGLDDITGLGTFSLIVPGLPHPGPLTARDVRLGDRDRAGGAVHRARDPDPRRRRPRPGRAAHGAADARAGAPDRRVWRSGSPRRRTTRCPTCSSPARTSSRTSSTNAAGWSVGALLLLMLCKALAYSISLSSFRGGPVFPAMFIGAAGGVAAAELPGMELVPAVGMGIGAMCAVMLSLPLSSVLLATLLMGTDGLAALPVVIVAVVVAYVVTAHLTPAPAPDPAPAGRTAAAPAG